jgi:hypothetical protein
MGDVFDTFYQLLALSKFATMSHSQHFFFDITLSVKVNHGSGCKRSQSIIILVGVNEYLRDCFTTQENKKRCDVVVRHSSGVVRVNQPLTLIV